MRDHDSDWFHFSATIRLPSAIATQNKVITAMVIRSLDDPHKGPYDVLTLFGVGVRVGDEPTR